MIEIAIADAMGHSLRAKVEIGDGEIVVHSRSGAGETARNPQYRPALEAILSRLQREGLRPEVYLDSAPVRSRPLAERRLALPNELTGSVASQFDMLIRRSNDGSASRGAWRRLLLRVPTMPDYALRSILDGSARQRTSVLPVAQLERVGRQHVETAIAELRSGAERPTSFDDATGYLLVTPDGGAPLPPKKVFGIALAEALQTYITPQDFSSGERIFGILNKLGFKVIPIAEAITEKSSLLRKSPSREQIEEALAGLPITDEERAWVEGDVRVATHLRRERSGALPKQFKSDFRAKHGKLFCQRCDRDFVDAYGADAAEACFEAHHTVPVSQMLAGHQTTPDQLQLLCANCHRITHRLMTR